MLVSGGEDGTVRMWDSRSKEIVNIVKPHTNSSISRPELGHWIGDVSLNEDWMVMILTEQCECKIKISVLNIMKNNFIGMWRRCSFELMEFKNYGLSNDCI